MFERFVMYKEVEFFGKERKDGDLFFSDIKLFMEISGAHGQVFVEVVEEGLDVFDGDADIVIVIAKIIIEVIGKAFIEFLPVVFFGEQFSFVESPGGT